MTPSPTNEDASALKDLPASLDLAVFEEVSHGRLRPIGRLPDWWALLDPSGVGAGEDDLGDRFPILELFLPECRSLWDHPACNRVESDIWTEHDTQGGRMYLRAVATRAAGRRLITLAVQPQELFTYQQLAHDLELAKEKVESMSYQLELRRQEAERATRAKSDFLAVMSHEIRTPLNAIIGMADLLSATELTPEQQRYVDVFQRNGVSLLNLINDILDLSKVEAGKIELESVDMDLRDVIGRAMEVIDGRARAKGLGLASALEPSVPVHLVGDPNRLRQILINLLGNSIKFTDQGRLEIQVSPDPERNSAGCLRFAVKDTGVGIPQDKVNLVFESFTQADSSTTRNYGGTGLGLSISKQLVELMGGRIWVESQVGIGSTFYFTAVFRVQDHPSVAPLTQQTQPAADLERALSGLRILLVDDSDDNRFLIQSYLKNAHCSIEIAENGEIAAAMVRTGRYDAVLMDIEMPVMDGYAATREIRRFERESNARAVPILALTAHAIRDVEAKTLEAGFTAQLTKPIRKVTLLEALARHARPEPGKASNTVDSAPFTTAPRSNEQSAEPIRIHVEPGMEDIVPAYLDKRRADILKYREAIAAGDFEAVRMLGHKMKGTGAGYGFEALTASGAAIERAAQNRDAAAVLKTVSEVAQFLDRVALL